jgi:acyl-CoA thioesterase I
MNQDILASFVKKGIAFGIFCLLISLSTLTQANSTILVMGDSLSAEYGLQRGTGWVKILERQLAKEGSSWRIFNASISGETSSGGISKLPRLLQQEKPGIVMIELGANDALRGLSIDQTESNLLRMIALSKKSGARVLLFGMQIPPNYGQVYAQKFKEMYPRIAAQEHVELVPFFLAGVATQRELFQADNIHPNEKAQILLFKNVWGAMAPFQVLLKP